MPIVISCYVTFDDVMRVVVCTADCLLTQKGKVIGCFSLPSRTYTLILKIVVLGGPCLVRDLCLLPYS